MLFPKLALTSGLVAAASVAAIGCARIVPTPSPPPLPPPPPTGATACPPAAAQPGLLTRLSEAGLNVTGAGDSTKEVLFSEAASACLMNVGNASFSVVFFTDSVAASRVHVCEESQGSRYLYRVKGRTIDAAFRMYWSVSDNLLISTNSPDLDSSLRHALGGVRPPC